MTKDQAQALADKVLKYSTTPECSVTVTSSEQAFTRFANNGITTSALVNRHAINISATRDGRTGTTVVNDFEDAAIKAAVKQAEDLAGMAPPNPEHRAPLGPQQYPAIPACDDRTAQARAADMLPSIKAVIETAVKQKMTAAGLFERITTEVGIANKKGLSGYSRTADAKLTTTLRLADGSSSGWAGQPSTRVSEIDGAELARVAADKCMKWRNPKRLDPGKYTVVFEPTATGDIVNLMFGNFNNAGFSARSAEEGRSFLSKKGGTTKLGDKLFPDFISLRTDPFDPRLAGQPLDQRTAAGTQNQLDRKRRYRQPRHRPVLGRKNQPRTHARRWFPGDGWRQRIRRGTHQDSRTRPACHSLLVYPLRQSADAAVHRPHARWPVPYRKRKSHRPGHEFPLQRWSAHAAAKTPLKSAKPAACEGSKAPHSSHRHWLQRTSTLRRFSDAV